MGARMAFGPRVQLITLVMMALVISSALALFPEQAGKYDWFKNNIGFVNTAAIDDSRVYVSSKEGGIAALDAKDGSVVWRVVLDEGEQVQTLEVARDIALTLSSTSHVRAFSSEGRQLWEAALQDGDGCSGRAAAVAGVFSGKGIAIIACGETLQAKQMASGKRLWSVKLPAGNAKAVALHLHGETGKGTVAMLDASGAMHIAVFDVASGDLTKHGYSSAGHKIDPSSLHALETGALALTVDKSRVCSIAFFGGKSVSCQTMKEVLPSGTRSASAVALSGTCPEEAVLQTSEGAVILGLQSSGGALAVTFVAGAVSSGCGDIQVAAARASEDGVTVDMISSSDGVIAKTLTAPDLRRVTVSGTPLRAVSSFAGPFGEVLVQLEEGTLAFFSPGASTEAAWIRNEALSGVTDLLFADLPAPTQENEAQWAAQQPSTSESLRMQLLALKVQVGMATSEEAAAVERHAALTSDRLRPTRDPDGFRKQLLVTTAAGKVASLHTGDGRVMWSLDFGPGAAPNRLTAWHTPHDTTHDALVAAIASSSDGVAVTVINIRTGEAVERESIAAKDADILLLPRPVHVDTADQSVLVVVPKDGGAPVVLPKTDAARAAFAEQAAGIVRWAVSADGSGIEGVGVSAGGKSKQLWRVAAAPEGSKLEILAVAAREANEAVYSAALPVFGGGVLLKNLNPNTLLVVAGPPKGTPAGKDSKLVATLIDAASGRVLFTQTHTSASGPVHAIVSEHWAAYHYWSAKHDRWQIAVIDAYRPAPPGLSVVDLMVKGGKSNVSASAYDASSAGPDSSLIINRQVYGIKMPVAALGVTRTVQGTAAKMLLLGTPAGQVCMVDRRMLDARRPIIPQGAKPTPAQQAEGLPPYAPELTVTGQSYATLDKKVARLKKIVTAPAVLESASLLVAVGLDLFYIRLQPSKGFDMVPDDFPFALLVAMVTGLLVALGVLRAVMQQRALKLKWQ